MKALAYSVADAAERIGISDWQLRRWVAEGLIPVLRLPGGNRRVLIAAGDLEAFVAGLERVAAPEPNAAMSRAAIRAWQRRRAEATR